MSHLIAAIDESMRPNTYLLCATVTSTANRTAIRRSLRRLLLPNQRRLHAKHESDSRKKLLFKSVAGIPNIACHVAAGQPRRSGGRDDCLEVLVTHLVAMGVREIILEQVDQGTRDRDRKTMRKLLSAHKGNVSWRYEQPENEPLLWVSDVVLSAVGGGRDWRQLVEPVLSTLHSLGTK